jgi:hypothetical protein
MHFSKAYVSRTLLMRAMLVTLSMHMHKQRPASEYVHPWLGPTSWGAASHKAARALNCCDEALCSMLTASLSAHSGGLVYRSARAISPVNSKGMRMSTNTTLDSSRAGRQA